MDELLDAMERRLATLAVQLGRLLPEEPVVGSSMMGISDGGGAEATMPETAGLWEV